MEEEKDGTVLSTSMNLIATMVGLAVLSMPNAAGGSGMVFFWGTFVVCFVMFFFSLKSFADAARPHNCANYQEVLEVYIGKSSSYIMQAAWLMMALMVVASYLIVTADAFHKFSSVSGVVSHSALLGIAAGVMLPISLPKSLHSVRLISTFSNIAVLLIFVAIVINWGTGDHNGEKESVSWGPNDTSITLSTGPLVAGGFGCHINGIRGLYELKNKNDFTKIILIVGVVGTAFYSIFVIAALSAYGSDVDGDIQKNLQGVPGGIARVAMGTATVLKAPLIIQPTRDMIEVLLNVPKGIGYNVLLTTTFIGGALGSAYALGSLSTAMTLLSGTSGVTITWILPGVVLWYYKKGTGYAAAGTVNDDEVRDEIEPETLIGDSGRFTAVLLVAGGAVFVGLTFASQLYKL